MPAMSLIATGIALLLAATFAWAAVAKVLAGARWRAALDGYGLPVPLKAAALALVPLAEAAAAALLALSAARAGAALGLALVSVFSLAVVRARALRGDRLPCGCFGGTTLRRARSLLARNALLAALCAVVVVSGPRAGTLGAAPAGVLVPVALVVAGVALAFWLAVEAGAHLRGERT